MYKQVTTPKKPIHVYTPAHSTPQKGPVSQTATQTRTSDPHSSGTADGRGTEETGANVAHQSLGFPPAGMDSPQAFPQLHLLTLAKPHDEPSAQAVLKELLSASGQEQVCQFLLSNATPQIKALVLEMIAKALGSPHCRSNQLFALIAAYAPHITLNSLVAPVWSPESPEKPSLSGLDRVWMLAERLAAEPQQLQELRRLSNERWPSSVAWRGWSDIVALAQCLLDLEDSRAPSSRAHPAVAIGAFLDRSRQDGGYKERLAFFNNLWLSAVVNGVSTKAHNECFVGHDATGYDNALDFLSDRSQYPQLLHRLSPSLSSGLNHEEQMALLNQNLARMAVQNPGFLRLLAPRSSDSWTNDDKQRATWSVEFALQWWKTTATFNEPLEELVIESQGLTLKKYGEFWHGLAQQHPDWWSEVVEQHPWAAQVIRAVEVKDGGSTIVRVVHQKVQDDKKLAQRLQENLPS